MTHSPLHERRALLRRMPSSGPVHTSHLGSETRCGLTGRPAVETSQARLSAATDLCGLGFMTRHTALFLCDDSWCLTAVGAGLKELIR